MPRQPYQQLDAIDQAIVDALRIDGRRAYRDIARDLGVSESMVRKRCKRLLESGWMRILAISDPLALGVPVLATTYARVRNAALDAVTDAIARHDSVRYVGIGIGANNLVVESLHASSAELHAFLQDALAHDDILSSQTMQVVKIKKSVWDWEIRTEPERGPGTERDPQPAEIGDDEPTSAPPGVATPRPPRS
ncbi:MAG: Lrp/AsnC family transcriptional regulator [Trueperaceae bacterium]|nr:MAG: Lrp/AsnC family transcriptional regulator [Trueperaceae bacterium]